MSASRDARWSYWLRPDGLVHRVLARHRSPYVELNGLRVPADGVTELNGLLVPVDGVTECGHLTFTPDDPSHSRFNTGWFVCGDEPPTCILCATGTCSAGEALYREETEREVRARCAAAMGFARQYQQHPCPLSRDAVTTTRKR